MQVPLVWADARDNDKPACLPLQLRPTSSNLRLDTALHLNFCRRLQARVCMLDLFGVLFPITFASCHSLRQSPRLSRGLLPAR